MPKKNTGEQIFSFLCSKLLSKETKKKSERLIVLFAIFSFLVHLLIIFLVKVDVIKTYPESNLLNDPIGAIYTPFLFILIYEVYLLVYYLPKSITSYVGKQYEIITLIIIRRLFKDLANLEITSDWFQQKNDLQFSYDLVATLVLFFLIYIFYRIRDEGRKIKTNPEFETENYIRKKKMIALMLVPVLLGLAIYSLFHWVWKFNSLSQVFESMKDVNKIFFSIFFTILILTDVLLLLLSLFYTDKFNIVIRNSGFIISTILIRLSFGTEGFLNPLLIIIAVLFGILLLLISNKYDKHILPPRKS
ncbi:MAG: hypothetical protein ABFS16_16470 [Bacteroidota bacterium]